MVRLLCSLEQRSTAVMLGIDLYSRIGQTLHDLNIAHPGSSVQSGARNSISIGSSVAALSLHARCYS